MFSWAIRLPSLLRQRPLRAASRALIVYLDLFFAEVHLDGFLVPGDLLSDTDLLFEHDLLGVNDLLLEDLHDHLVLADIRHGSCAGFPGLTVYRHALDDYLLASLRDPYHLTLCSHALLDVHLTGFALADAGSEFLLRALHPQVFLEDNALLRDRPYRVVRRLFTASLVSQSGPFWAGSLCSERPKQGDTPHKRTRPPRFTLTVRYPCRARWRLRRRSLRALRPPRRPRCPPQRPCGGGSLPWPRRACQPRPLPR